MTGSYPAGSQFIFVLAPGTVDGFTVTVTTEKATWSISKDVEVVLEPGKYKNLGTLEFEQASAVSASAAHTYENGILTGTDVTLNLNIPEAAGKYITQLDLQVKNAQGTEVRTLSKKNASATEVIGANDDWPYLPQGEYTVSGNYTLSGNTVKELEPVSFTSPAPEFTVKSNAYSSYTKYLNGDISGANSCAPETIYNINSASVTISDKIRNNTNYDQGFTYEYDGTSTISSTEANQSWGPHSVTAKYSFDKVEKSDIVDCHITGLPFDADPPTKTGHTWSDNSGVGAYINWNSDGVRLEGESKKQTLTSPSFNIPNSINTKMTVTTELYTMSAVHIYAIPHLICRIGGSEVINKEGTKGNKDWLGSSENLETYTGSGTGELTNSNNTVEVENAYTLRSAYIYVKRVKLEYN